MIELNWTMLVQLINFLLLIWILNRILYRPVLKVLNERDSRISGAQDKTKKLIGQGESLVADYEVRLRNAKIEAMALKTEIRKEAAAESSRIIDEARQQSESIVGEMRASMSSELERVRRELEPELGSLASEIAEQILGRKVA